VNRYTIIPSSQQYKSAPSEDQQLQISLQEQSQTLVEYDRTANVSLAQVFDEERQASTIFRPTFKVSYLYENLFTGTTEYLPFQYNLYLVDGQSSVFTNIWKGYPQYYEFDFFRDDITNTHINYKSKSAFTYNWTYYYSYPFQNNFDVNLSATLNNTTFDWVAKDGIPFVIKKSTVNGNPIISFECISPHGLTVGESVELKVNNQIVSYRTQTLFEVFDLGNGLLGSEVYIFSIYDIGFTGNTFANSVVGTFKRVVNFDNIEETKSKYYIRQHKIISNIDDVIVTKTGFEKNSFNDEKKIELSSITPNKITRISQKNSSNTYTITPARDLNLANLLDNQQRPLSELFLTIINRGYSGYFNAPTNGVALKQGWLFNITKTNNSWWSSTNINSNSNIGVSSYTQTNGVTKTFYYNQNLKVGDIIDGDFCEWNEYFQIERVISKYYHKLKFNQNVFQTSISSNPSGYYYQPHHSITIRVFSDYIETAKINEVDSVPSYSFYSVSDESFRWRDLYTYGFIDNLGRGVDYPFFNGAQYPYSNTIFKLIPDDRDFDFNDGLTGLEVPYKPLIDKCE